MAGDDRSAMILIVDDDTAVRHAMADALSKAGYRVEEAGNGFEARVALDSAPTPFDLVVMDQVLPGMEGHEVANLLKAHDPGLKVLYTSGFTSQESLRSGLRSDTEAFLRKPFEVPELIAAVEEVLAS